MRKAASTALTALLVLTGLVLVFMGLMSGRLCSSEYRYIVEYFLGGASLVLLLMGVITFRGIEKERKGLVLIYVFLPIIGLLGWSIIFGMGWILFGEKVVGVMMAIIMPLYGLVLLITAMTNYLMSRPCYRPMFTDFLRELPFVYYRYRI